MRIDTGMRAGQMSGAGATARRSGVGFSLSLGSDTAAPARTAGSAPAMSLCDLQSLMALQAYEDPAERKKRVVRRGFDMLDVLEGVKMDLLVGRVSPDRLERLVSLLGRKGTSGDPRVDQLMEDIELRAKVELAKLGRYTD